MTMARQEAADGAARRPSHSHPIPSGKSDKHCDKTKQSTPLPSVRPRRPHCLPSRPSAPLKRSAGASTLVSATPAGDGTVAAPGAALVQHVRWTVLSFQVRLGSNQQASTHFTGEAVVSNPTELRATDAAQSYVYGVRHR